MKISDLEKLDGNDLKFIEAYFTWKSGNKAKTNEIEKLKWFYDVGYEEGVDYGHSFCSS